MSLLHYIIQDLRANKRNVKGQIVMILFRMAQLCRRAPKLIFYICIPYLIIYRVMVEWVLCIELPWNLTVGEGLRLYHGQALVVNDRAVIGKGCVLRHSTTIGVASTNEDFLGKAPVIGDFVDIGSNVIILGSVIIGDGAVIGAGSVVVKDVKAGAVVVGNPAHEIGIINSNESLEAINSEN